MCIRMHTHLYICTSTQVHILSVFMYVCLYARMHVCMYVMETHDSGCAVIDVPYSLAGLSSQDGKPPVPGQLSKQKEGSLPGRTNPQARMTFLCGYI